MSVKGVESILYTLGVTLVLLIALYGVSHLIITYAPAPVGAIIGKAVNLSTPAGWATN